PVETMTNKPPGSRLSRFLFGILAYASLGIGIAAIFIPGLPTTEFILLAAWLQDAGKPLMLAIEEQNQIGMRISDKGEVVFFNISDGAELQRVALPIP
ncbi:YbaN family protein, partial [Pseudomonas viridiflava]|uniref:YbaN family protein n=1 Tax=Pseudomonas viridiflava TaxID=33069 RepID=UPI00223B1F37